VVHRKRRNYSYEIKVCGKRGKLRTQGALHLILAAGEKRLFLPITLVLLLPEIHSTQTVINAMIIRVPEEEKSNLFLLLHRSKCDLTFSLGLLDGKSYLLFVEGRLNALMCKRIMHLPNCQLTESLLIILSCLLYLSIVL